MENRPAPHLDDSATVWSSPWHESGDRALVLLLHGRGSHEHDLFSLVPLLPTDAVYVSLRAPIPEGAGWSWFGSGAPGEPSAAEAIAATRAVLSWLDGLAPSAPVAVVGFSQGGAMALQLLRFAPDRFRGVVNLAGFVIADAEREAGSDAALPDSNRAVFWGRDPGDPVIPQTAIERTGVWTREHATATVREYPGIGHSVSREEIDDVATFLRATVLQ